MKYYIYVINFSNLKDGFQLNDFQSKGNQTIDEAGGQPSLMTNISDMCQPQYRLLHISPNETELNYLNDAVTQNVLILHKIVTIKSDGLDIDTINPLPVDFSLIERLL